MLNRTGESVKKSHRLSPLAGIVAMAASLAIAGVTRADVIAWDETAANGQFSQNGLAPTPLGNFVAGGNGAHQPVPRGGAIGPDLELAVPLSIGRLRPLQSRMRSAM